MKKRFILYFFLFLAVAFTALLFYGDRFIPRYNAEKKDRSEENPAIHPTILPKDLNTNDSVGVLLAKLQEMPQKPENEGEPLTDEQIPYLKAIRTKLLENMDPVLFKTTSARQSNEVQKAIDGIVQKALAERDKILSEKAPKDWVGVGNIVRMEVKEVQGHPDLLAVIIVLSLDCDNAASFHLYQRMSTGWKCVLNQVNENDMDDFSYQISPPDEKGNFFVLSASEGPHCQSCWGGLGYQAVRIGKDPDHPQTLTTGSDMYYRCGGYETSIEKEGFTVTYGVRLRMDLLNDNGVFLRSRVDHFQLRNGSFVQVEPFGLYPEDFLDEWLEQPWEKAKDLCVQGDADLKKWHESLKVEDAWNPNLLFVQPCTGKEESWQIGISTGNEKLPKVLYFEVIKKSGNFFLKTISAQRPAGCPGETKPDLHANMG